MRATSLLLVTLVTACGAGNPTGSGPRRLWVERDSPIPQDAPGFALAADARRLLISPLGSWNEPLVVRGTVLSAGRRAHGPPLPLRHPGFRGSHELVVATGVRRITLQYDSPVGPAPVTTGERVRVVAHSMSAGSGLAFAMAVYDHRGALRMAGLRAPDESHALLPPGWSIARGPCAYGPEPCTDRAPRAVRLRGPGGEIVLQPGRTAIAALGPEGSEYAADLHVLRPATRDSGSPPQTLSLVIRSTGAGRPRE